MIPVNKTDLRIPRSRAYNVTRQSTLLVVTSLCSVDVVLSTTENAQEKAP